jgi:hypothetical protein
MAYVPAGAELATAINTCDVPEPGAAMEAGLKLTEAPAGAPEELSITALLKPLLTAVVMVAVTEPPCAALNDAGLTPKVKSGLGVAGGSGGGGDGGGVAGCGLTVSVAPATALL